MSKVFGKRFKNDWVTLKKPAKVLVALEKLFERGLSDGDWSVLTTGRQAIDMEFRYPSTKQC